MNFQEEWSRNLKVEKWMFQPLENSEPDEIDLTEPDDSPDFRDFDPNKEPDVSSYVPISLEELTREGAASSERLGTPDWQDIRKEVAESCKRISQIWEKHIRVDYAYPPVITEEINSSLLENVRDSLAFNLFLYAEINEYSAWLDYANSKLEELRGQLTGKAFFNSQKVRNNNIAQEIKSLEKEIEEFENDWLIGEKIYELEDYLKDTWRKRIVEAQKRVAKYRASSGSLGKYADKPLPREIRNSYDFEIYCGEWFSFLGAKNAYVSNATKDGGVDLIADDYIAQVKLYNGPIPVAQIRDLLGTSMDFGKKPVFFASMSYSRGSIEFADRNIIPLFIVDSFNGEIRAANSVAEIAISRGLQG